ncbi:MAG TPA: response regulator [bacterium]|nr:response regulator [bacterium]
MKVLIAEDDLISRNILEATLAKRGYEVIVTTDGTEAWETMKGDRQIQLAVLDWMMPGIDGVNLCKKLKAWDSEVFIYVLLLTARTRKEDVALGLNAGADDYITKPFSARELLARVSVGERMIRLQNQLTRHVRHLRQFDQKKNEFLAMVSHELRTPIAIMKGGVSLCLDGVAGDLTDTQTEVLTDTLESIDRLNRLVTDLLDLGKIESGKMTLHDKPVNLCELTEKVVKAYQKIADKAGVTLSADLPGESLILAVDEDKINQIFNNLLNNAFRFTPRGGCVSVGLSEDGDSVHCFVKDTGRGIAPADLPKVFSKFEQFGYEESGGSKGSGLGLAITKALVELHGGRIDVESKLGEGSVFTFSLQKNRLPKILIVDDEETMVELVQRFLENQYQYLAAHNGLDAVRMALEENPSLIVLDMMLPGINGYDVIRELKQHQGTAGVPIVINSAFPVDNERLKRMNENRPIPVLHKPLEPGMLQTTIKEMLAA